MNLKCEMRLCPNNTYMYNKWKNSTCSVHGKLPNVCLCPAPFTFFRFPGKSTLSRAAWIKVVREADPFKSRNWEPDYSSRICSVHFPAGRPTPEHPLPVPALKTDVQGRIPVRRNLPGQIPVIIVKTPGDRNLPSAKKPKLVVKVEPTPFVDLSNTTLEASSMSVSSAAPSFVELPASGEIKRESSSVPSSPECPDTEQLSAVQGSRLIATQTEEPAESSC